MECNGDYLKVDVKNCFVVGDVFEFMIILGNIIFKLIEIFDKKGNLIFEVKGLGYVIEIFVFVDVDMCYVLLICNLLYLSVDILVFVLVYVVS